MSGGQLYWHFLWTNMTAGHFRFLAFVDTNGERGHGRGLRPAQHDGHPARDGRPQIRTTLDDDDDGLYDADEVTPDEPADDEPGDVAQRRRAYLA